LNQCVTFRAKENRSGRGANEAVEVKTGRHQKDLMQIKDGSLGGAITSNFGRKH